MSSRLAAFPSITMSGLARLPQATFVSGVSIQYPLINKPAPLLSVPEVSNSCPLSTSGHPQEPEDPMSDSCFEYSLAMESPLISDSIGPMRVTPILPARKYSPYGYGPRSSYDFSTSPEDSCNDDAKKRSPWDHSAHPSRHPPLIPPTKRLA